MKNRYQKPPKTRALKFFVCSYTIGSKRFSLTVPGYGFDSVEMRFRNILENFTVDGELWGIG